MVEPDPMIALTLIVLAFAAARITRYIVSDDQLDSLRERWFRRFPPQSHPLGGLVQCPYCMGAWVSGAMLLIAHAVDLARWPMKFDLVFFWTVAGVQMLINAADSAIHAVGGYIEKKNIEG
jgi:hypothetical protein